MDTAEEAQGTTYDPSPTVQRLFLLSEWARSWIVAGPLFVLLPLGAQNIGAAPGVVVAAAMGCFWIASILQRLFNAANQKRAHRERSQRAIASALRAGQPAPHPYALYLRPFITSESLTVANSRYGRRLVPSLDRFFGRRLDLETVLAVASERLGAPLIALGDTGFELGAAKVVTGDEDWQRMFMLLAEHASSIYVVPLPRPSTLWEVETLLADDRFSAKALFIMPMRLRSGVQERLESYWDDVCRRMRDKHISFPAFEPKGAFFALRNGGTLLREISSGAFDLEYVNELMKGMLTAHELNDRLAPLEPEVREQSLALVGRFLYLRPDDGLLCAGPLPLHEIPGFDDPQSTLAVFRRRGWIVVHRLQEGSQSWWEAQIHPRLLDSPVLLDWASRQENSLRNQGKRIEAHQRAWSILMQSLSESEPSTQ
jgi:hypothetical protein